MVEEVLEGRAEEVDDQDVVETFLAKVVDIGNASCPCWLATQQGQCEGDGVLRQPTRIL